MATREHPSVLHGEQVWVEGRLGLAQSVQEILLEPGGPRLYSASCQLANVESYLGAPVEGHTGAVGFTWEEAALGAIGESVERYSCASCDHDALIYASKNELGDDAVGMDTFALHTERQYQHPSFPFPRWTPEMPIHWVEGESLLDGGRRYIPASLVYIPYRSRDGERPKDLLGLSVSTGQACHTDRNLALLSGLCEVVERDAFMITWVRRLQPRRVDYLSSPRCRELYERHFSGCHLQLHLFDLTLDIRIPTMLCVAEGVTPRGPFLCVGASTRPSAEEAAIKALKEAAQGVVWVRNLVRTKPDWRPEERFANVRDFEDHVRLFCEPDMVEHARFLLETRHHCGLDEVASVAAADGAERTLAACLDCVGEHGLDVVAVDITSPEMAELGFYVPKVFVPGLVQLTAIHLLPAYGNPRYDQVPAKLGFVDPVHAEFNPIPHPFP
jgi:ribosomal protein S12 methylthiotransferase accessory factor